MNSKQRILLIIDSLTRGGTQRQVYLLTRELAARGHIVRILALNDDTDPTNAAAIASVAELEIVGKARLVAEMGPIGLWHRFRKWRPDVILTMLDFSDLLGRIAGRLYGSAPVVSLIRGRNLHKRAWWLWLDKSTMRWADRVVFNSIEVVPFGKQREGVRSDQVCVIPNGVDVSEMVAKPTKREDLNLRSDSRILLTIGRLQREKRFDTLFAAMAQLSRDLGRVDLLIAGTGPLLGGLREEASRLGLTDRVLFLGKRDDVPALLALADLFVLPSEWEGMPNVVMEAMGAGCPVVATRIDGTIELLPDSSYGWLVEPGKPEQLTAALAQALGNREEAKSRAERARARAIELFSVDAMADRYEALFEELTQG